MHPSTEFHRHQRFLNSTRPVVWIRSSRAIGTIECLVRQSTAEISIIGYPPFGLSYLASSELSDYYSNFAKESKLDSHQIQQAVKVWPRHPTGRTTRFAFQCRELRWALGKLAQDQETLLQDIKYENSSSIAIASGRRTPRQLPPWRPPQWTSTSRPWPHL